MSDWEDAVARAQAITRQLSELGKDDPRAVDLIHELTDVAKQAEDSLRAEHRDEEIRAGQPDPDAAAS